MSEMLTFFGISLRMEMMRSKQEDISQLLQLNKNEQIILNLLDNEHATPLTLASKCSIPRPTIYLTLQKLRDRGLVTRKKIARKIRWQRVSDEDIDLFSHRFRKALSTQENIKQEKISINDSSQVIVHRGQNAIFNLLSALVDRHVNKKMIVLQGNMAGYSWSKSFSVREVNIINRKIKRNKVLTELVTSRQWFESQTKLFGIDWAKDFEGRTMRMQDIGDEYLDYASQIFIFGDRVFIDSMSDKVFIEIKNPDIAKLLVSMTRFIQDHSEVLDANELLRELINKNSAASRS